MDKSIILNFLFPPRCMFCNEITIKGKSCPQCVQKAEKLLIPPQARQINQPSFKALDKCISFYYYKDSVRDAVLRAKFVTCAAFAENFCDSIPLSLNELCTEHGIDTIISMPAHRSKFYKKEYDLPSEMAKRIAKNCGLQYNKDLVKKVRATKNQHDLPLSKRKTNLSGAFALNADVKGRNILIVDDIVSTGYSLEQVAKCLKKGGAATVIAVAFAYNNL